MIVTQDLAEEEKKQVIAENLGKFQSLALLGILTAISCMMSVIGQLVYNIKSGSNFPFD